MPLTLKIIAPSKLIPGQIPEYQFDNLGGSIGRKPNNDFILLDPERYISSKHAIIEFNHDKYYITDTSTNGVFINNSKTPLGSGNSEELMNGDKISIGDFQLLVSLNQTSGDVSLDQIINTPTTTPNTPYTPSSIDESFYNEPAAIDENIVDPLAILGGGPDISESQADMSFPASTADITPNDNFIVSNDNIADDLIGSPHENIPEPSPINEPFTPPGVIPDDWDIMGDASTDRRDIPQSTPPIPENFQDSKASSFDQDDIFSTLEENNAAAISPTPLAQSTASHSETSYIDSFLQGAGIDTQRLNIQDKHALMQKIGRLTRNSVEGLMIALRARATIKSNFRVSKTTISPVENNPLKFLVTADDALITLLSDDKAGYMSADEAFNEGFKDLQTHQMALMAGMQATINAIVKQFDPENLERSFETQGGSGLIPGQKKSKNWDSYVEFHAKLSDRLLDDFQNVYGEEFAHAYEMQINKLL